MDKEMFDYYLHEGATMRDGLLLKFKKIKFKQHFIARLSLYTYSFNH